MRIAKLATVAAALAMLPALAVAQQAVPPAEAVARCDSGTLSANLSPEAKDAVGGINAFSLDLYKRTLTSGDNQFLSPASVSTAVALAYRGAVGQTADELRRVLHYNAAPDTYFRASAGVFATMNFCGPSRVLQSANAIWVQDGMPLKPDYVADVQHFMDAGLQRIDFGADPEKARDGINAWVASATHDRITGLLQKGDVTELTSAVLVNAIYWKGRWGSIFDARDTRMERFKQLGAGAMLTPLMHQDAGFAVVERGGVQAIDLPYVGGQVSMVVLLPRSPRGLPEFEAGLTDQELIRWFAALDAAEPRETVLTLPKMHLEWRRDLKDTLIGMGAPTPFGDADFSGMAAMPYPGGNPAATGLTISHVIHKAWLDVDEEGAEAAAATAVTTELVVSSMEVTPRPPPIVFRADRPFLFVLRDRRTGLILFVGRYVAPPRP